MATNPSPSNLTGKRHKSQPLTEVQKAEVRQRYTAYLATPRPTYQATKPAASVDTMSALATEFGVSVSVIFRTIHQSPA